MSEAEYGFTWRQAVVERRALLPDGSIVICVRSDGGDDIDVYVSPKGKRIRVFRGLAELKAEAAA